MKKTQSTELKSMKAMKDECLRILARSKGFNSDAEAMLETAEQHYKNSKRNCYIQLAILVALIVASAFSGVISARACTVLHMHAQTKGQ